MTGPTIKASNTARTRKTLCRGFLLAPIAFTILAIGPKAQASEHFEVFKRLCVETDGDLRLALLKADREGWKPIAQPYPDRPTFRGAGQRINPRGDLIIMVGEARGSATRPAYSHQCAVVAQGENSTLLKEARAWVGVPTSQSNPAVQTYVFSDDKRGRIPIRSQNDRNAAVKSGRLRQIDVNANPQSSTASYTSFTSEALNLPPGH